MQKVSLVKCTSYNEKEVYEAVKKSIDLIGGLNIKDSSKVLIKPNLLVAVSPDKHASTHPSIIQAIIKILKEKNCTIFVGDSPGFHDPLRTAKATGILEVCKKENVKFIEFKNKKSYLYKEAIFLKRFDLCDIIDKVDYIINVPKLKTHAMMHVTLAIKNTFGFIIGLSKSQMHLKLQDEEKFGSMLVDLNNFVKPTLNIMDGIIGMEGNGPQNGDLKKANIISASHDSLAMDIVMCKFIGFNPLTIPTNKVALTKQDSNYLKNIQIVGEKLDDVKVPFKPSDKRPITFMFPKSIGKKINHLLAPRPIINTKKCKACGECITICPAKTISMNQYDNKKAAYIHKKNCIRCFCCHEICPFDSIIIKKNRIGKVLEYIMEKIRR
jgi:uncharacterized protein (DUF362 family)/NAD-dependent dihydropyrimidine dehydrogenase PreA subunit